MSNKRKKKNKNNSTKIDNTTKYLFVALLISLIFFLIVVYNLYIPKSYSETRQMMGTYVTITVYHQDQEIAYKSIDKAFSEGERIENILSDRINTSDVYVLNENKTLYSPRIETIDVLMVSDYIHQLSNGAFDITIKPILDLYTYSFQELKREPTDVEIQNELNKINQMNVVINGSKITIGEEQSLTLGGIAKGYIVDKMIETLKKNDISSALVNAGGDLRTIGRKPFNQKWSIALSNPDNKREFIMRLNVENKSVATSGNYERYFDENKRFHHIINPMTGRSALGIISVTVVSQSATLADGLSTAVFVLGANNGLRLVENFEDTEALIITEKREIVKSSGWDEFVK